MSETAAVDRLLSRRGRDVTREVVTPEGVPLHFVIAPPGGRIWAFFLDTVFQNLILLAILAPLLLIVLLTGGLGFGVILAAIYFAGFVIRNFYFTWFEIRWQGATPGKRRAGIRVIDRGGGPLSAEAVFARNLTRDLEIWLPLGALSSPSLLLPGAPEWAVLPAAVWLFALALLPLFNRYRLRVGDLVGGTLVVRAPRERLLGDLTGRPVGRPADPATCTFTDEQLDVYGASELQILEDLLRLGRRADPEAIRVVCEKIRKKIDWTGAGGRVSPRRFLEDFYAAQRARLERKMLLGVRKESKRED